MANHNLGDRILANDVRQLLQVSAFIGSADGWQALCGYAQRIRDGQPNSARTHIERQQPGTWLVTIGRHIGIIGFANASYDWVNKL